MDFRDHHLVAPFGWSVMAPGGTPAQVASRTHALRADVERVVRQAFDPARGYELAIHEEGGVWEARVTHKDFEADLTLAVGRDERGQVRNIRLYGTGGSRQLDGIVDRASRLKRRSKVGGTVLGALIFTVLCWLSVGVYNPVFVLGGLLMAVVLLLTLMGGASIGTWIAERVEQRWMSRVRSEAVEDAGFQTDLKRWRAMTRQLTGMRAAVAGLGRHQPFRAAPEPHAEAAIMSSFSFSS